MTQTHAERGAAADRGRRGRSSARSRCSPNDSMTSSRASTTCMAVPIAETVFEPHVGGNIYDRGVDGSECRWARVLAYEPPNRVVFSWDISPRWQIETDPDQTSEVEVRFIAESAGPDPGRARAPQPRPPRRGLGSRPRRCRRRRRAGRCTCTATSMPSRRTSADGADHDQHRHRPSTWAGVRLRHRPDPVHRVAEECRRRPHGRRRNPAGRREMRHHASHRLRRAPGHVRTHAYRPTESLGVHGVDGPIRAFVDVTVEPLDRTSLPGDDHGRLRRPRDREASRAPRCAPTGPQGDAGQPGNARTPTAAAPTACSPTTPSDS